MSPNTPYATPIHVESLDDCMFYHSTYLPEIGEITGQWDLRPGIDDYLGRVNFAGKRVLDVGTASGVLSFHIEKLGAEVVSYDLSPDHPWDVVPFARADHESMNERRRRSLRKLNNSYWLSHRLHGSKAQLAHGTVYSVPEEIGSVDISVFGSILLHVRDPFLALQQSARLTRETVIVAEPDRPGWLDRGLRRVGVAPGFVDSLLPKRARFMPRHEDIDSGDAWWSLPPSLIREYLGILGFEDVTITYHTQSFRGRPNRLYTAVGRRTHGRAVGDA